MSSACFECWHACKLSASTTIRDSPRRSRLYSHVCPWHTHTHTHTQRYTHKWWLIHWRTEGWTMSPRVANCVMRWLNRPRWRAIPSLDSSDEQNKNKKVLRYSRTNLPPVLCSFWVRHYAKHTAGRSSFTTIYHLDLVIFRIVMSEIHATAYDNNKSSLFHRTTNHCGTMYTWQRHCKAPRTPCKSNPNDNYSFFVSRG